MTKFLGEFGTFMLIGIVYNRALIGIVIGTSDWQMRTTHRIDDTGFWGRFPIFCLSVMVQCHHAAASVCGSMECRSP